MNEYPDVSEASPTEAKQILRSLARGYRARRRPKQRAALGEQFAEQAFNFCEGADVVAAYVSVNAEPRTDALITRLREEGKHVLVPKLGPKLEREWAWFTTIEDLSVSAPGRPPSPSGPAIGSAILRDVDVFVIPALLLNHKGQRLGQGGGWYDRILKVVGGGARVAGLIYDDELVDFDLPQDPLDMTIPWAILPDRIVRLAECDA